MMRFAYPILILTALAACVPASGDDVVEPIMQARSFSYDGKAYLTQFRQFGADLAVSDGSGARAYALIEAVAVSRSGKAQFEESDIDKQEARSVALAYCKARNLSGDETAADFPIFNSQADGENAEWVFEGICHKPDGSGEVAK